MHALVVQVRSRGPWVGNGTLLSRLVQHVRLNPASLDKGIDPARISVAVTMGVIVRRVIMTGRGAGLLLVLPGPPQHP